MWLHVDVTAAADEPFRVTPEQISAALDWLDKGQAEGWLRHVYPFPETGGIMDYWTEATSQLAALNDLRERLVDYPLIDTITYTARELLDTLGDGFDRLAAAQAQQVTIAELAR